MKILKDIGFFFLFLIASALKWVFSPFLYIYGVIRSLTMGEFGKYHFDLAYSKDQYGNVVGQYFFNDVWIKPDGYKFGKPDETMSSALGKNKRISMFRKFGESVANFLNKIDTNHVEKSIEDDERKGC